MLKLINKTKVLKAKRFIFFTYTLRKTKEPLNNCLSDQTVKEDLKQAFVNFCR